MSLHIGNLSSHCQTDELERVFRRFGRCELLIKDRYGFVVYDFPAAAERALKMLQGRNICGQDLTLTWSRKQPKGFKTFSERARDRPHGLNSSRGRRDHTKQELDPNSQEDVKVSVVNVEPKDGRPDNDDIMDQKKEHKQEHVNGFVGEDHDGDGDGAVGQLNLSANESFERYKPDQSHENEIDDIEDRKTSFSGGSPTQERSLEKLNEGYDGISRITCFTCGGFGHKMRNCRLKNVSSGKYSRLGYKADNRHESHNSRLNRGGSSSWITQPARNYGAMRQYGRDRRTYHSGKRGGWMEVENHVDEQEYGTREKGIGERKRGNREDISPKDQSAKIARRSLRSDKSALIPHSDSKLLERDQSSKSRSSCSILQSSPHRKSESSFPKSESFGISLTPENTGIQVETGNSDETKVELEKGRPEGPKLCLDNQTIASEPKHGDEMGKKKLLLTDITQNDEVGKSSNKLPNQDNRGSDVARSDEVGKLFNELPIQDNQSSDVATNMILPEASSSVSLRTTDMSPDELFMVLKHYGLEVPNESDMHSLTPEAYFGSARIWPWSVIYYRRLRKGPVSVENYARRLAQNKEFGIVDKFVRSSSGWGESELLDS